MAYQKRNFKKDQLLTADDLNAMDDQIASNEESAKKANDDIKNKLDKSAVVKEKGYSETAVMSQAAATVEFDKLSEEIDDEETARNTAITQERNRAVARENEIEGLFTLPTQEAVDKWLNEHPEATTTVLDASLGVEKFTEDAKKHVVKDYVTPQMYGAVGDGVTDDTEAFQLAIDSLAPVVVPPGKYLITKALALKVGSKIVGVDSYRTEIEFVGDSLFSATNNEYNIHIESIYIKGNGNNIAFNGVYKYAYFHDVKILNVDTAFNFAYGTWITKLTDISVYTANMGVVSENEFNDITFERCRMEDLDTCFKIQGRSVSVCRSSFERFKKFLHAHGGEVMPFIASENYLEGFETLFYGSTVEWAGIYKFEKNYLMPNDVHGYLGILTLRSYADVRNNQGLIVYENNYINNVQLTTGTLPFNYIDDHGKAFQLSIVFKGNKWRNATYKYFTDMFPLVDGYASPNGMHNPINAYTDMEYTDLGYPNLHVFTVENAVRTISYGTIPFHLTGMVGLNLSAPVTQAEIDLPMTLKAYGGDGYNTRYNACLVLYKDSTTQSCVCVVSDKVYITNVDNTKLVKEIYLDFMFMR